VNVRVRHSDPTRRSSDLGAGEPIYGVTTGFGSNADKLLGSRRQRDGLPGGNPEAQAGTLLEELQHNLIVTHAVCVGAPLAAEVRSEEHTSELQSRENHVC